MFLGHSFVIVCFIIFPSPTAFSGAIVWRKSSSWEVDTLGHGREGKMDLDTDHCVYSCPLSYKYVSHALPDGLVYRNPFFTPRLLFLNLWLYTKNVTAVYLVRSWLGAQSTRRHVTQSDVYAVWLMRQVMSTVL